MELWTFLISMMPIGELRFSVPFGYFVGLNWYESFIFSLLGNALITYILISFINFYKLSNIQKLLNKLPFIGKIFRRWHNSALQKSLKFNKFTYINLALFVSIPLPITGAWTAVMISTLLGLRPFKSFIYIFLGLIISCSIVTIISYNFSFLMDYFFINANQIKSFIFSIS